MVDRAKKEVEAGYRPEIEDLPIDIDDYDVIFVGSPCWWYTMAPAVTTFLSSHDFKGKAIAPFMTHEGQPLRPYAGRHTQNVSRRRTARRLHRARQQSPRDLPDVREWIERLGLKR